MKRDYYKDAAKFAVAAGMGQLTRASVCKYLGIEEGSFRHRVGMGYTAFIESVADRLPLSTKLPPGTTRASAAIRRKQVLACALELSKQHGYARVTREMVAEKAGTTVGNAFGAGQSMAGLREQVVRYAVDHGVAEIIEQARANGDPLVQ